MAVRIILVMPHAESDGTSCKAIAERVIDSGGEHKVVHNGRLGDVGGALLDTLDLSSDSRTLNLEFEPFLISHVIIFFLVADRT